MAVGIRVTNDYGTTQIDQDYKNYGFVQIIPITVTVTSPSQNPQLQGLIQVTVPGLNALAGIRCTNFYYTNRGSYFDGSNWVFTFRAIPGASFSGTLTDTVYVYVFNSLETTTFSNVGIRVRHPTTGEIAFHSDMRPLYIEALRPCNQGYSGDPSRVYCPLITKMSYKSTFISGRGYFFSQDYIRIAGSTVQTIETGEANDVAGFFEYSDHGEYAMIDVTDYS
jgi:hypothetical protein